MKETVIGCPNCGFYLNVKKGSPDKTSDVIERIKELLPPPFAKETLEACQIAENKGTVGVPPDIYSKFIAAVKFQNEVSDLVKEGK